MEKKIVQTNGDEIGHNIRRLRKLKKLKAVDVISKLQQESGIEITAYSFSKIENGTQNVTVSFLRALTHILECDFNDIFELSEASYYNKKESRKKDSNSTKEGNTNE